MKDIEKKNTMRKRIALQCMTVLFCIAVFLSGGCAADCGTFTIADLEIPEGGSAPVQPVFSGEKEEITYSYDSDAILIEGDVVYALAAGAVVEVTASTERMSAYFAVTTLEPDRGTLTVKDIEGLAVGQRRRIFPVFSVPRYAEEVSYTFAGSAISIEDGFVTALEPDARVEVQAKTAHHTASFFVTTVRDYGTLFIGDIATWVGYPPSDFVVEYSRAEAAGERELTFKYDESVIQLDAEAQTVRALREGETVVTASDGELSAQFTVRCMSAEKSGSKYDTSAFDDYTAALAAKWEQSGHDGKTTLFIGDSFFDTRYFWTDFDFVYAGKDALCFGISSTTTYDWEVFADGVLKAVRPKNIVIHLGTNNIYDDGDGAQETLLSLQRLLTLLHGRYEGARLYYFGISLRTYGSAEIACSESVNAAIKEWCALRDWVTYIDTPSRLTGDMLRDNVHPKLEYYRIFTDALAETDIEIDILA